MKKITQAFLLLILIGFGGYAQQKASKYTFLDEGSEVKEYPQVDWLKGNPVKDFKKDKIYIIELWATWCVPCMIAMPHLNELSNKFKDKGILFIAQNVMEDNKSLVEQFVKRKGDQLNYSVAYSGAVGSDFDKKWLKPAGVNSIPQTFVIQNNMLIWITNPTMLNEKVLQLLVDKKFTIQAAEALKGSMK